MRFRFVYAFVFLFLIGMFVSAENISDEQDLICSISDDCRVTSCGNCVNKNQEETRFCARPQGDIPYTISCACENSKCASKKTNKNESCTGFGGLCCKGDYCSMIDMECSPGLSYSFVGCDDNCSPVIDCINKTKTFNLSNGRKVEIKIMPEAASQKAIERLGELNFTIELKEVGNNKAAYELTSEKVGKMFGLFKTSGNVSIQVDAETGKILKTKKPWWAFLASGI